MAAPEITEHRTLPLETITPEAFAPFGTVLTPTGRNRLPIDTYGDRLNLYREDFETDQPIEWFIVHGRERPLSALFLERHQQLTQTFIPLGGHGLITIVARADAEIDGKGLVAQSETRAFLVPGDMPFQLHRGTWHENPFPTQVEQTFLVTSHAALTKGHQKNPSAALDGLPLDLERRHYAEAQVSLTIKRD